MKGKGGNTLTTREWRSRVVLHAPVQSLVVSMSFGFQGSIFTRPITFLQSPLLSLKSCHIWDPTIVKED